MIRLRIRGLWGRAMKKPVIDAGAAIEDIRAGMDDASLMNKYHLSARGLQSLFKKLLLAGALSSYELEARRLRPDGSVIVDLSELTLPVPPEPTEDMRFEKALVLVSADGQLASLVNDVCSGEGIRVEYPGPEMPDSARLRKMELSAVVVDMSVVGLAYRDAVEHALGADPAASVILIAEAPDSSNMVNALTAGAAAFVHRPVDGRILLHEVRQAMERAELVRFRHEQERMMEEQLAEMTRDLTETKDFLTGILNSSDQVSIVLTDLKQNVLFWNKGAETIFGYPAEEMLGSKIGRIYLHDDLTKMTIDRLREMIQTGMGTVHGRMRQIAKDGRLVTVSLSLSPITDSTGKIRGIVGIGLDVSEQIKQSKELLRLAHQRKKLES